MNPITIYSQNALDKNCTVTPSTGAGEANLYDNKPATLFQSSGSNDATPETLLIDFLDAAGSVITKDFDTIILLNTNVKALSAAYKDISDGNHALTLDPATLAAENAVIESGDISAAPAKQITLSLQTTQTADEEKYLGELKLVKKIIELNALSSFSRKDAAKCGNMRMADGSLVAWSEYQKVEGTLSLQNVSQSDRDALLSAIADNDFLTFAFFDDYDPAQIYEFLVAEPPSETFDRKTRLYELELSLKER